MEPMCTTQAPMQTQRQPQLQPQISEEEYDKIANAWVSQQEQQERDSEPQCMDCQTDTIPEPKPETQVLMYHQWADRIRQQELKRLELARQKAKQDALTEQTLQRLAQMNLNK